MIATCGKVQPLAPRGSAVRGGGRENLADRRRALAPHLDVAAGGILDRGELAAAGLARRDFLGVAFLDPGDPVGPPRSRMFSALADPAFEVFALGGVAGPVLVFHLAGRIDDAGDMAGAGQYEAHRAAEARGADINRFRRRDVIL